MTASSNGDDNFPSLAMRTPQIEEKLVGDENTNDFFMALSSSVLNGKKEML